MNWTWITSEKIIQSYGPAGDTWWTWRFSSLWQLTTSSLSRLVSSIIHSLWFLSFCFSLSHISADISSSGAFVLFSLLLSGSSTYGKTRERRERDVREKRMLNPCLRLWQVSEWLTRYCCLPGTCNLKREMRDKSRGGKCLSVLTLMREKSERMRMKRSRRIKLKSRQRREDAPQKLLVRKTLCLKHRPHPAIDDAHVDDHLSLLPPLLTRSLFTSQIFHPSSSSPSFKCLAFKKIFDLHLSLASHCFYLAYEFNIAMLRVINWNK